MIRDMTEVRKIEDYYDIREKIGEGRFATVYRVGMSESNETKCVDKKSLQECAVKVINKTKLTEVGMERMFYVERSGSDPDRDRDFDVGAA